MSRIHVLISCVVFALQVVAVRAATIQTIPIGLAGNPADPTVADPLGTCCYGAVPYTYRIGAFEITNDQYVDFLNAVAADDLHQLYDPLMAADVFRGGIVRSGTAGNYVYSVKQDFGNKPVNYICFWDATRFVNWLHNGRPAGQQNNGTTEDGTYSLHGVTFPDNKSVTRNEGARWFLPSEDEWYKAAYYDPRSESEGGPPEDDYYWRYATQSDDPPIPATSDVVGNISNPGPNVANYLLSAVWNRSTGNVTTVGSAGPSSGSFFGTFDQAGNVWEWNEAIVQLPEWQYSYRGNRGGNWDDVLEKLMAEYRAFGGIEQCGTLFKCFNPNQGFRVARLFSPLDLNGDDVVDSLDIDVLSQQVTKGTLNTAYDLNADSVVDAHDRTFWVEDLRNTYFGDADLDGEFDSNDLIAVLAAGQYEDAVPMNSFWSTGDWDGDAEFNSNDLIHALQAGGYERGPREIARAHPEPSTRCYLVIGLCLLARKYPFRSASSLNS